MEQVLGIGGVFFKARDPKALAAWYREHLGVPVEPEHTPLPLEFSSPSEYLGAGFLRSSRQVTGTVNKTAL